MVRQICNVKSEDRISACKLRIRLKLIRLENICGIEDQRERRRVLGRGNAEPCSLVVVSPEDDLRKNEMR